MLYASDIIVTVDLLAELKAAASVYSEGASVTVGPHDVLLTFASGDSLTLKGVTADWLII